MTDEEKKQIAINQLRALADWIEAGAVEIEEVHHEVGVAVKSSAGAPDKKTPSGDQVLTIKYYEEGKPRATYFGPAPGTGTWRSEQRDWTKTHGYVSPTRYAVLDPKAITNE